MRKYINVPYVVFIMLCLFLAVETINMLKITEYPIISIFDSQISPLNVTRNHFYIYSVLFVFMIEPHLTKDVTLEIFRYSNREKYYFYKMIVPVLVQSIVMISSYLLIMILITIFVGEFSIDIIYQTLKGFIFYIIFYSTVANVYSIMINLGINKYIAIVLNLIVFILFFRINNLARTSFGLLTQVMGLNLDLMIVSAGIFWLSINIILWSCNQSLFNRKDIK